MPVTETTRPASPDEIAAEMDRRGAVIEKLEAQRDALLAAAKMQMAAHKALNSRVGYTRWQNLEDEASVALAAAIDLAEGRQ
ncbi:hypothetical protein [Bosea minatitlanensis]|uniref:Uncharacterized protein n=1 Tax=Bosea minatitlanensis TaxID=128782 RepID=A0ABW0F3D6_9HYPH|nr:hypothetical protein [Bosea minatitlanensis]MCT4492762.1 hypothetical protein [Bosea minatitlanensis]